MNVFSNNLTVNETNYIKNNKIKVAMLPDFPPFSIYEDNQLKGFSYDILQLISKKSGLNFEYSINKWPQNIKDFKEKKVDMIDAISYNENRLSFTNYTSAYYEVPLVIFSRKDLTSYDGLNSLKDKKLGMTKNIFYKTDIENLNLFNIVEYDSFQDKLKALAFGEVDIIFGHLLSTQIRIKKMGYTNIKVLDELHLKDIQKTDLRFGIDKDNLLLYSIIQKTYKSITKNEWETLNNKWISIYDSSQKRNNTIQLNLTNSEKEFLDTHKINCITTNNWPPFNFLAKNELVGISLDFWKLISQKANINFKCQQTNSFVDVLTSIQNKKADLTLSTAIVEDRLKYSIFSKSYISYPIAIATKLDKNYIEKTAYLENKKIAVGKDFSAYKILSAKYPEINFIQVKNTEEALKLVSDNKAYAAVDILPTLSYKIVENKYKNIKIAGTTEFSFDVRIMIRDDYKELLSVINKSIDSIDEKEKNSIGSKWLAVKFEEDKYQSIFWNTIIICLIIVFIILYKHFLLKNQHTKLITIKQKLEITQNKLKDLNNGLEQRVEEEVEKNRLKDMQMMQQSRLAQLGEMISMIAHQWRQPLNAISVTAMNIQMKLELEKYNFNKKEDISDFIEFLNTKLTNIENYTQSLTLTIDDFRNFYKPDNKHECLTVNKAVKTAINIIEPSLKSAQIKLTTTYNSKQPINMFKNELMQVILNILKNSQDQFLSQTIHNQNISIHTIDENDHVTIKIYDNAGGISSNILDKIFDPYFSTKGEQSGTGLGLYMSKIIIEEHHKGKLMIKNFENGVCVEIIIPITDLNYSI